MKKWEKRFEKKFKERYPVKYEPLIKDIKEFIRKEKIRSQRFAKNKYYNIGWKAGNENGWEMCRDLGGERITWRDIIREVLILTGAIFWIILTFSLFNSILNI